MSQKIRPSPLSTKSFTRYEPASSPVSSTRSRASTIASPTFTRKSLDEERQDVFNKKQADDDDNSLSKPEKVEDLSDQPDELPIELVSLIDR